MKSLPPFFIHAACVIGVLLTAHIICQTSDICAEGRYLSVEKPKFMVEIDRLLKQQQEFKAYRTWDYYSHEYVMKMQDDQNYSLYRDLHHYQRDFRKLQKALAQFHNNHVGLWYHKELVLPVAALKKSKGPLPENIGLFLKQIEKRLNIAHDYFETLP